MRLITLHLPEPWIEALDKLVEKRIFPNRAEAIRIAVRELLLEEKVWNSREKVHNIEPKRS